MEFGLVTEHAQGGAQVVGFQAAGIQRPPLHQVPGINVIALPIRDLGDAAVSGGDVAPGLAFADAPVVFGRVLADIGMLGAREDQLHDLVDPALEQGLVGPARCSVIVAAHGWLCLLSHGATARPYLGRTGAMPRSIGAVSQPR
jgi:hypothetical protein